MHSLLVSRFPGSKRVSTVGLQLGMLLHDYVEAHGKDEKIVIDCLNIERILNPNSEDTIKALNLAGKVLIEHSKYQEAIALLRENNSKHYWESYLTSQNYIARSYARLEYYQYAEELLQYCIASGKQHQLGKVIAEGLQFLGDLEQDRNDLDRSEAAYVESLQFYESTNELWPEAWKAMKALGSFYSYSEKFAKAEEVMIAAIARLRGNSFIGVVNVMDSLQNIYNGDYVRKYSDCERTLLEMVSMLKNVNPLSASTVRTMLSLADFYYYIGRHEQAENIYQELIENNEKLRPNSTALIPIYLNYANFCMTRVIERFYEGETYFKKVINLCNSRLHYAPQKIQALSGIADIHCKSEMNNFDIAEENLKEAMLLSSLQYPNSVQTAACLSKLADFYSDFDVKRYTDALQGYQQALAIYQAINPSSSECGRIISNIGEVFEDQKQWSNAEAKFIERLELTKNVNIRAYNSLYGLSQLANYYQTRKQYAKAEEVYTELIHVYRANFAMPSRLGKSLSDFADFCKEVNRKDEQLAALKEALAAHSSINPKSSEASSLCSSLAECCEDLGYSSEAEKYYKTAMEIEFEISPCEYLANLYSSNYIEFLLKSARKQEIESHLNTVIDSNKSTKPIFAYSNQLKLSADYNIKARQFTVAEANLKDRCALYRDRYPKSNSCITTLFDLADFYCHYNVKQTAKAEDLLIEAVKLSQSRETNFYSTPLTVRKLAKFYKDQSRFDEAEAKYQEVISLGQRIMPKSHRLVRWYLELGDFYSHLKVNKVAESEAAFKHALSCFEQTHPAPELLASVYRKLAGISQKQKNYTQQESYLQTALTILKEANLYSTDLAQILSELGYNYIEQGRLSDSESVFQEGLAICMSEDSWLMSDALEDLRQLYEEATGPPFDLTDMTGRWRNSGSKTKGKASKRQNFTR